MRDGLGLRSRLGGTVDQLIESLNCVSLIACLAAAATKVDAKMLPIFVVSEDEIALTDIEMYSAGRPLIGSVEVDDVSRLDRTFPDTLYQYLVSNGGLLHLGFLENFSLKDDAVLSHRQGLTSGLYSI